MRWGRLLAGGVAISLGLGCTEEPVVGLPAVCEPVLEQLSPGTGAPGTEVELVGMHVVGERPEQEISVRVGGVEAAVLSVGSTGCDPCYACIREALLCQECDRVCDGELAWVDPETGAETGPELCDERLVFEAPKGEGEAEVVLWNSRGSAGGLLFSYE